MPYVGQLAEIPAGVGTLTSDNNAARARFLDLIVAEGIVSDRGVWEREPGATPYTNAPLAPQTPGFTFADPRVSGAAMVAASFRLSGEFENKGSIGNNAHVAQVQTLTVGLFGPLESVTSGSTIVISWSKTPVSAGLTSITDPAGNIYTKLGERSFPGGTVEMWAAINVAELANGTVITLTKGAPGGVAVFTANVYGGLASVDEVITTFVGVNATSMTQAAPFVLQDPAEALVIAYSDLSNGSGVTPTNLGITQGSLLAFGISAAIYQATLPLLSTAVNALSDYWPTITTQRLLALGSDGRLYKSSGAAFSALTMATTMANQPGASMIVVGGQEMAGNARKAFVFDNGVSRIQTLSGDGASTTDFGGWNTTTNIPLDWSVNPPRGGIIHKERLWAWSPANAPHNIYASKLRDHENFKNAVGGTLEYVQEIGTGAGLRIAAAASFKGMLFVFKYPRGIYFLDDTDVDYLNWRWNVVSEAIGVADSPFSVIVLDDDILFMAPDGHLHFISAVTQQGVLSSDMTAKFNLQQWTKENVNLNRLGQMTSAWYPAKKLAMIGAASLDSGTNDLRVFLDFSNVGDEGATARISYSYRDVNRVLSVRRDEPDGVLRPISADDDGLVWKMDRDFKTVVGRPNVGQARYQYSPTDFSHLDGSLANKRKLFDALTINFNPTGAWNLAVDSIIDGSYHETLYFAMGGAASVLGSFRFGDRLGGGSITTSRRRMTGNGYWLSIAGWVQGEGHDFSVAKHLVNFRVGGEEQR